ncbi:poly-gamma-glutamate hydrolase family protein [Actinoplanes sp. URMC 104]|uniref:poly-gamma-glutamate hydrolase family protein n=1 Tax=Actinoplanes sp. URMC 104 TaxID=3423409 RepID=UPI003F19A8B4
MSMLKRRTVLTALGAAAVSPVAAGARPALAADDYESNTDLYSRTTEGVDYVRRFRRHAADESSPYPDTAILALHGGAIEGGTSELCLAIAGYKPAGGLVGGAVYDYWMLEGIRPKDNGNLHVTSTHCDDPVAEAIAGGSRRTLSLHGFAPEEAGYEKTEAIVLVGGRDTALRNAMVAALNGALFDARDAAVKPKLSGEEPANIVNRNLRGAGVQFEMTTPLRRQMFGLDTRLDRKDTLQDPFWKFVNTVRGVLAVR